jgi:hypothetical protein
MSKLIEAIFFPERSESLKEKPPRILILDDDSGFTRAAKFLSEKTGSYFLCEQRDPIRAHHPSGCSLSLKRGWGSALRWHRKTLRLRSRQTPKRSATCTMKNSCTEILTPETGPFQFYNQSLARF